MYTLKSHPKGAEIATALGLAGFFGAIIFAAKVAPRAKTLVDELPEDASMKEKVQVVTPVYAPVVGLTLLSTGAILFAGHINAYRYAALMALLQVSERNADRLREAVLDEVGQRKYEKIENAAQRPDTADLGSLVVPEESVLFYDKYSGRYFTSGSVEEIRAAVNDINEMAISEGFASLNELYYAWGLPPTEFGDVVGWTGDKILVVLYSSHLLDESRPVVSLSFAIFPQEYGVH